MRQKSLSAACALLLRGWVHETQCRWGSHGPRSVIHWADGGGQADPEESDPALNGEILRLLGVSGQGEERDRETIGSSDQLLHDWAADGTRGVFNLGENA